mmetsp:Transcript_32338/g.84798  ORF Transcript_32338/g.84798 Transcript_32338/m.84798 type:complete len:327 (-) Transcript_32338:68-1048(-)
MKVAPQQQQAFPCIAPHLAPIAQRKDLVLLGEGMNDWRALAIGVTQLCTPKVPRAEVAALLRRPELACLDGHMPARLEYSLELRPEGLGTCSLVGEPGGGCAGDRLCGAYECGQVAAPAARDVKQRSHATLGAVDGQAARFAKAAVASPRHTPLAAAHEAVLLGDVGKGRVLGLDDRPVEFGVGGVGFVLVDVHHYDLVDLHVHVLLQPVGHREEVAQVLRHLECRTDALAGGEAALVSDVTTHLALDHCTEPVPWPLALARAAVLDPDRANEGEGVLLVGPPAEVVGGFEMAGVVGMAKPHTKSLPVEIGEEGAKFGVGERNGGG